MKLSEMYKLAVDMGIKADPRGKKGAEKVLEDNKKTFEDLSKKKKEFYDKERLNNPYSDTRILYNPKEERDIKKIISGIDIDDGELIAARQLGDVDAAVAHHPEGAALAGLDDVMHMQADVLNQYGVPINVAEALLHKRITEVSRGLSPGNHYRVVEIARLLDMPFMCTHTVTDNLAYQFLKDLMEDNEPYKVKDIFDLLLDVPEYREAQKMGFGPTLFAGKKENRTGKIAITEVTGGTEGAHDIYEKMANAGIGTVIAMHQSEKHRSYAEKAHLNVVIAGHMSSDSVGMNHLLDAYEKKGVEIVQCGGLIRVSRN
ncbi:MAG: hypothetical protein R3251_04420 [Candidatus Spechtbacterales bacterium]|nr:hypothetical protein [Candidatus Spechtbacterales bacterium]